MDGNLGRLTPIAAPMTDTARRQGWIVAAPGLRCYHCGVGAALPTRAVNLQQARAQHGDLVDRFLPALMRSDPLADDVAHDFATLGRTQSRQLLDVVLRDGIGAAPDAPSSLRALFSQLDHVPVWVDWPAIGRGSDVLFRTGLFGGTVLGAKSLVTGYCSPGGNKPLVFSGQLEHRKRIGYRLAETCRFVADVCERGGMRRFGPGFATTVRVRIMHATVRRLIAESGKYDEQAWGVAINQHDMVGTTMLFSLAFLEGVRAFGFRFTAQEVDDFLHLWRYNGWLIGVEPELLPTNEAAAARISDLIAMTQGQPDDDARMLVRSFIESPSYAAAEDNPKAQALARRHVALGFGFTRSLLGDEMADALELPRTATRLVLPGIRKVLSRVDRVGRHLPGYDRQLARAGRRYWQQTIELGLAGRLAQFMPPAQLDGLRVPG
ncbi:MAG: oxygenase MpaB family protein [Nannocystales bacterium]